MIIGVKVGSALLTSKSGSINKEFMLELCRQITMLMRDGHNVFLVTSGAVSSEPSVRFSKNLRAAIGQTKLISLYRRFFRIFDIKAAQMLLTDRQLRTKRTRVTKRTIFEAFRENVVPIINGNDVVDDEELKALKYCADNDQLFKLVCLLIKADIAVIGFNEAGVIGRNGEIIRQIKYKDIKEIMSFIKRGRNPEGMKTKIKVLSGLAKHNIKAILAPGKEKDFVLRALAGEEDFGTLFQP